ncbi:FxSxx-COOH system tetratricopeptide repeat protein [Streptomyces sp. ACA25]|uniref:FxSxx-COOH system tetratricopeptide repeat protein n=1 Tax=Streptomyces sp. ACA25 TaxID=3022596 RepID=UPI002307B8AF|nr:FxSxx-COOH system tetratricopeptide repeat protein [Streptomyces sp. ACA25]MDB1088319.1 FxSxx-COOH system tetratricopeptide repeat protein [Streptomyces sp. ACA25]
MTQPPSPNGLGSSTVPGTAPRAGKRADPLWYEAGEAVWLAAQRERLLREAAAQPGGPVPDSAEEAPGADVPEPGPVTEPELSADPGPAGQPVDPEPRDGPEPGPEPWVRTGGEPGPDLPGPISGPLLTPGTDVRPAVLVRRPAADPGPGRARAVEQALRPLRRRLVSPSAPVLDEEATAASAAEYGVWLPRFRPGTERRLSVSLVVDSRGSMRLWSRTAERFAAALGGSGAFRDVRLHRWSPGDAVALRAGPPGRHMVLVLTDLHESRWSDGSGLRRIAAWAEHAPTAVVSVLPEHLWPRMATVPRRARLTSPGPAVANSRWSRAADDFAFPPDDGAGPWYPDRPGAVPVPVLELTPEALHGWARFVSGDALTGYVTRTVPASADSPVFLPASWSIAAARTPPADLVRAQRARLSPTAYRLALLCAAVPVNLTLLQLLSRELAPEARTWHLAELLFSGLLRSAGPDPGVPRPARVELEFAEGVREELLAEGTRGETARAMRVAFGHLAEVMPGTDGASLRRLQALVADPSEADRLPLARLRPWLEPALPAFTALDGQFTVLAAEIGGRLAEEDTARIAEETVPAPGAGGRGVVDGTDRTGEAGVGADTPSDNLDGPEPAAAPAEADEDAGPSGERGNVSVGVQQSGPAGPGGGGPRKPPPVWGNVPPRNRAFTGRGALLDELHQRLQQGTTAVLPEALQGMGGVGKSQLAVEYVYRHLHEYQVIWWIPAEQPQQIRQVLVELAARLGLQTGGGEASTAVPAVIEALRVGEPYKNWLLVFDNAEDPREVSQFFPTNGSGRILVTSRNARWATAARPLEVDVFTREESRRLLQLRAPSLDDGTADRLAETLGDLPLGVEQAAVWLAETGMPADEYLRLFEQQASELGLSDPPVDYPRSVAAAWNVSLERLRRNHPAALQLLQVCAFFAPEPISRRLLTGVRDAPVPPELAAALSDPIRLSRAIREINRYALARINHSTNTIQLHRLVQRVLITQMPDALKTQMRNGAHGLLAKGDPGEPTASHQWQQYGELLPHVLASGAVHSTDPWVRQLVLNMITYMYSWGDHAGSLELAERAHRSWRTVEGERNEHVLQAAKLHADALRVLGLYRQAYDLDAETRRLMTETLGPEHEATLEITSMLAWDLRMRGQFRRALELDQETFEATRRLFGPNDISTLIVAHRVALNLRLTGSYDEALEMDRDTHRRKVEELGENALSTLSTLAAIVLDLQGIGSYLEARDLQKDVSSRYEYNYGATNPSTLASYRGLAVTERRAGRHDEARELSTKVLSQLRRRYGDNYPQTLATLLAHSVDVRYSGELHRSVELSEQSCKRYDQIFGPEHPHTRAAQVNHAVGLRLLGRSLEAKELNEQARASMEETLGPDHPNVLACATNLAVDLYELGEVQKSVELSTRLLEQGRQVREDHPGTSAAAVNLALGLRQLGRGEEADALLAATLERYRRTLGPEHPATAAAAEGRPANCDIDPIPL